MKILHYKSNFLNLSETFIRRVINNHQNFEPVGMCIKKKYYTEGLQVYEKPQTGIPYIINTVCFHLNWCLPFYKNVITKTKPALIHAHFGFDGYRMMKPAAQLTIPLVVSFYGSDVSRLPREFDWKRRYQKLARRGDAFICPSNYMKRQLITLGFPVSKIHIIPFGLELNKFNFNADTFYSRKLMMVGRMVEKKGFSYAIDAVKILQQQGTEVTLDLYGDGELMPSLKKQVSNLNLSNLVKFHGSQSNEHVLKEHACHNILLAPSLTAADGDEEGLPNTILEAMAAGTLVITTNHAAISETVTHKQNGLIANQKDAKSLANAINRGLSATAHVVDMKKNARKTIENHFRICDVVTKTEAIYQDIIDHYA